MKKIAYIVTLIFLLGCKKDNTIKIGEYLFETPNWWADIEVPIPESIKSEDEAAKYIEVKYGAKDGTKDTWKYALKGWAIFCQRNNFLPIYIGHCFVKGGELENAAKIYTDLYFLANTDKKNESWFKCYLAYSAGEIYKELKDLSSAKKWYSYSAEVKYSNSDENPIKYYSNLSRDKLNELTNSTTH
ncbi:MAG: hypothetical protein WBM13_15255 [Bacteroidia bacterium]